MVGVGGGEVNGQGYNESELFTVNDWEAGVKKNETLSTAFNTYIIGDHIGGGGNGEVYSATNTDNKVVAIKVLSPGASSEKLKRFKNEFLFGQNHNHKNIIQTIDYGIGTSAFFVMPIFESSLRKLMKSAKTIDACSIFDQMLDGVEAAHLFDVVHRDLKPENILVRSGGAEVVVTDFGIARFIEKEIYTAVNTRAGTRLANFIYAAPEQKIKGQSVDHRADIFALGLMLNELFTGHVPDGANYQRIGDARSELAYLDSVVEKAIGQSPDSRYQSIEEFKYDMGARKGEFVAAQKLDSTRKIVIPETEIVDPIPDQGTMIIEKDWEDGELRLRLNHTPHPAWAQAFVTFGYQEAVMGKGPESFHFEGDEACIHATSAEAPRVLAFFKSWLPRVDIRCREILKGNAKQEQDKKQRDHAARLKVEETRLKVLEELNMD